MLTITLDWLAMTFKEYTYETDRFLSGFASSPTVVPAPAHHGYTSSFTDANGVSHSWNPDRSEMGHHAVFSGSALRNLFERNGISSQTLLREALHAGASITRLDLAKDAQNVHVDLNSTWTALERGEHSGTARTFSKIQSNNGGFTIYVGSRQSERYIRIYDKAVESQLPGQLWFRFEVETKGMVARATAISLSKSNNWSGVFDGLVLGMVGQYESLHLEDFADRGDVPIGLPKIERRTDREKWIAEQVLPAVARHFIDNPNSEAVSRLINALLLIAQQRKE